MHGSNHCRLGDPRNEAVFDRCGCCDTQRMALEAPFAEKVTGPKEADDCFLAPFRNDGELDFALLNVKHRVGTVTLGKYDLTLLIFRYRFAVAHFGEKDLEIKRGCDFFVKTLRLSHSPG